MSFSVRIEASNTVGTIPFTVSFRAVVVSGEVFSFLWYFGEGSTAVGKEVLHTYNSVGSHTVVLIAYNQDGESVEVIERDLIKLGQFSFLTEYNNRGIPPLGVSFTNTSQAPTGFEFVDWRWSFGDMSLGSGATGPSHVYGSYGNYNVSLTAKLRQAD